MLQTDNAACMSRAGPCPRSAASDLVSAVRTAMLLSLGATVQDVVHAVPAEYPRRMQRVWQQVTPPAWQTAIQHAERCDSDAVTTVAKALLPHETRVVNVKVTVANAGAGGPAPSGGPKTKPGTKKKKKRGGGGAGGSRRSR